MYAKTLDTLKWTPEIFLNSLYQKQNIVSTDIIILYEIFKHV